MAAPRETPPGPAAGRASVLRSRVGRRILVMFLLAAGLPVALAAFIGYQTLVSFLGEQAQRSLTRTTRDGGMQVLGRLLEAKSLLETWPPLVPAGAGADPAHPMLAGLSRVFRGARWVDDQGQVRWQVGEIASTAVPLSPPRPGDAAARLLLVPVAGAPAPRVMLRLAQPQGYWLADVHPAHLWGPLAETAAQAHWEVREPGGPVLDGLRRVAQPHPHEAVGRWTLFLGGEFGATDWEFEQHLPPVELEFAGLPLLRWAVQLGAVVLLIVVLLSLTQIRRTLVPLEALLDGTRRLARRERAEPVQVRSSDEFGELARSFNEMAGRIDAQFQSLEALGLIDRAIVSGHPLPEVLDQLLRQALLRTGAVAAVVVRLTGAGGPSSRSAGRPVLLQWRLRQAVDGDGGRAESVLGETERPRFEALEATMDWPPAGSVAMAWQTLLPDTGATHWWACPARWQASCQAVLLLGFMKPPGRRRRHEACDLRDRLAVALAAHEREQVLHWRAVHDDLTGLANRHGLNEQLDRCLEASTASALAVLFIDLDHFKDVNDSLGHEMGDRLLQQAAERLQAVVPREAVVARAGGDEFVIVLPQVDEGRAAALARQLCERLAVPFVCGGHEHVLGASIGVALAPQHGVDRATLLRHADMAMYQAKQGGRGRHALFAATMDEALSERSRLLADLRRAVVSDELVLHYQPRVDARDGCMRSAEALVRWQHPELGLLSPARFIALAEESDLIEAIGIWVMREACAQMARWQRQGLVLERVSVNVSPRQLVSGRLVGEVDRALADHGVAPDRLELEVTESLLVGDAKQACEQLEAVRRRGVLIALDDFGTGYSSLSTLRQLPVDVMKVDRAFVKDLGQDDSALAVTRTILTLARSLGKHTVAEGMETAEQADLLRELGCDEMQGFFFSRPLTPAQFEALPQFAGAALASIG
ncbi:diguanylate cyclase (GGDEF)-like protein [Sphaerotilus hippei]|uniref:Diguanylate cyclase (GGDEF)-like protein n=1 Tax=Sphaerotilus hippei TaxID=744406 RepID=A0A318H273_9BURK|nr:EAL domain-containing protein [Sphaerotilus hippei]PXW95550.1 diguanylate cyclase (GGDEF)-like protein [Sphaerotilus hippei]